MKIRVLYFAVLREKMGRAEEIVDADNGATPFTMARKIFGSDDCLLFAVNDEIVDKAYVLSDGDQLAFIPPMAGG